MTKLFGGLIHHGGVLFVGRGEHKFVLMPAVGDEVAAAAAEVDLHAGEVARGDLQFRAVVFDLGAVEARRRALVTASPLHIGRRRLFGHEGQHLLAG